jgi:hypothetical protein
MLCDTEKDTSEIGLSESPLVYAAHLPRVRIARLLSARIVRRAASQPRLRSGILDVELGNTRIQKEIGGDEMRKVLIALVAAVTLGTTALATSSSADARWFGYGGWGRAGLGYGGWGYRGWGHRGWGFGGFAAGALAGASIASAPYYPYAGYYPYAPGYYAYAPTYYLPTYYGYVTTFGTGCGCCCLR